MVFIFIQGDSWLRRNIFRACTGPQALSKNRYNKNIIFFKNTYWHFKNFGWFYFCSKIYSTEFIFQDILVYSAALESYKHLLKDKKQKTKRFRFRFRKKYNFSANLLSGVKLNALSIENEKTRGCLNDFPT